MSQAPQHCIFSEMKATRDGCFANQSVCSVISLDRSVYRTVHEPLYTLRADIKKSRLHMRVWTSQSRCFTFLWQAPWLSENGNVCPGCHPSRPPVAKNVELLGCLRFQAGRTISTRQIERRYVSDCYETSTECISDRLLYRHKVTL